MRDIYEETTVLMRNCRPARYKIIYTQPTMSKEAEDFFSSLRDLTMNSKPHISMLTMLAGDYIQAAPSIVSLIENHIKQVQGDKLPILYLIDSIVKTVGGDYIPLFSQNIPVIFSNVFHKADEKTRLQLFKLRYTWNAVFPPEKLLQLDQLAKSYDPHWPVNLPFPATSIHVNPNFVKALGNDGLKNLDTLKEKKRLSGQDKTKFEPQISITKEVLDCQPQNMEPSHSYPNGALGKDGIMREKLLREKKELLELEKRKVHLQLLQTKEHLEREQRKLEAFVNYTTAAADAGYHLPFYTVDAHFINEPVMPPYKRKLEHALSRDPRRMNKDVILCTNEGSEPKRARFVSVNKNNHKVRSEESVNHVSARHYRPQETWFVDEGASCSKENLPNQVKPASPLPPEEQITVSENDNGTCSQLDSNQATESSSEHSASVSDPDYASDPKDPSSEDSAIIRELENILSGEHDTALRNAIRDLDEDEGYVNGVVDKHPKYTALKPPEKKSPATEEYVNNCMEDAWPEEYRVEEECDQDMIIISSEPDEPPSDDAPKEEDAVTVNSDQVPLNDSPAKSVGSTSSDTARQNIIESIVISSEGTDKEPDQISNKTIILSSSDEGIETLTPIDTSAWSPRQREESLSPVSLSSYSCPSPRSSSSIDDSPLKRDAPKLPADKTGPDEPADKKPQPDNTMPPPPLLPLPDNSGKDVDLRPLLGPPKQASSEERSLTNIAENNVMAGLFGMQDVDLRKPQLPSPPPPPFISEEFASDRSWANIKSSENKNEKKSPRIRKDKDRLGRPSLGSNPDTPKIADKRLVRKHGERTENNCMIIMKEAQSQFQSGVISFVEYNRMLNEVFEMNEEQKLHQAIRECSKHDEDESSNSSTEYASSGEEDRGYHKENYRNHYYEEREVKYDRRYPPKRFTSTYNRSRWERDHTRKGRSGTRPAPNISWSPVRSTRSSISSRSPRSSPTRRREPVMGPQPWKSNRRYSERNLDGIRPPHFPSTHTEVPIPDRNLVCEAESLFDEVLSIGNSVRNVRYYGDTGITMLSWDDAREISFQPGSRAIVIDNVERIPLQFGSPPVEVTIDGFSSLIRLGRPMRELIVDDKYYGVRFGGPPIDVMLCGKLRMVYLEGPPPVVRYGQIKRSELCAGTVNLILNGKVTIPVYLDGKPQKFEIGGHPCVLKFVDKFKTVLINGVPVPVKFGGQPVPIFFRGQEYFLRLTVLPHGVIPGVTFIRGMETSYPSPNFSSPNANALMSPVSIGSTTSSSEITISSGSAPMPSAPQQSLDILASVLSNSQLTQKLTKATDVSYNTEDVPETSDTAPTTSQTTSDRSSDPEPVNVGELYRKLIHSGLVSVDKSNEPPVPKETLFPPEVSLSRPESLRTRPVALITQLYDGIQCSTCGVRFPPELGTKKYSNHLDWHFRQNRKEKASAKTPHSRNWYYDLSDLIQLQDADDSEDGIDLIDDLDTDDGKKDSPDEPLEDQPTVHAGVKKNPRCTLCEDHFEEFFNDEKEEWQIRNAVTVEDGFYHPRCFEELKRKAALADAEQAEQAASKLKSIPEIIEELSNRNSEDIISQDPPESIEVIDISDSDPVPQNDEEDNKIPSDKSEDTDISENIEVDLTGDDLPDDSSTKGAPSSNNPKREGDEDDDDILQIEVIERKIESYDLLDDEDDKGGSEEIKSTKVEKVPPPTDPEPMTEIIDDDIEVDFSNLKVKKERESPIEISDSGTPTYIATIDGNIVHEKRAPLMAPGRIKININAVSQAKFSSGGESPSSSSISSSDSVCFPEPIDFVDDDTRQTKPTIHKPELKRQPLVKKGKETSGLCNIM